MRRLFLLRHAEAVPPGKYRDHERPLTANGREAAAHVGGALAVRGDRIDLALCSDSARTRETLDLALGASGARPEVRLEPALYQADRGDLMEMLRALDQDTENGPENVLVVGHNPAMAEFAVLFTGSGEAADVARLNRFFPPAALAIFEIEAPWSGLLWNGGRLLAYLR